MLQKTKSKKNFQWKYALIVPLLFGMLLYTSCSEENSLKEANTEETIDQEINKLTNKMFNEISEKHPDWTEDDKVKMREILREAAVGIVKMKVSKEDAHLMPSNEIDVPFAVIEKVPVYPGCEGNSNEELKACFSQKISAFVGEHFNTKLANTLNLKGQQRISVQFAIDNTGAVTNIKARGPHPELEAEAIRIMELLPQMTPGEQDGKKVNVLYSLPILFQVD